MAEYLPNVLPSSNMNWESVGTDELYYALACNNFDTNISMNVRCTQTEGTQFFVLSYTDIDTGERHSVSMQLYSGLNIVLMLPAATTNVIECRIIRTASTGWAKVELCPIEQSIKSVDIEFALGARYSSVDVATATQENPPDEEAWQSDKPSWTASYTSVQCVWIRVATIYEDGHTGYTVPQRMILEVSSSYSFIKWFCLSSTPYSVNDPYSLTDKSWSSNVPIWSSRKYIFACIKTDAFMTLGGGYYYTEPVVAQSLNPAKEFWQPIDITGIEPELKG